MILRFASKSVHAVFACEVYARSAAPEKSPSVSCAPFARVGTAGNLRKAARGVARAPAPLSPLSLAWIRRECCGGGGSGTGAVGEQVPEMSVPTGGPGWFNDIFEAKFVFDSSGYTMVPDALESLVNNKQVQMKCFDGRGTVSGKLVIVPPDGRSIRHNGIVLTFRSYCRAYKQTITHLRKTVFAMLNPNACATSLITIFVTLPVASSCLLARS